MAAGWAGMQDAIMNRQHLVLDLSKLVIAAAWADGKMCNDEKNALKDLLFHLDEVSGEDWAILSMYMESPVSEAEREVLLERVIGALRSGSDKEFALQTLEHLFQSDGGMCADEEKLMEELKGAISGASTHVFAGFGRALKGTLGKRSKAVADSVLRESASEDYIKNTLYYDLQRKQEATGAKLSKSEDELRKLCLATGLLARVAHVDNEIDADEQKAIKAILAEDWGLKREEAGLLTELACDRTSLGLDYFRLTNGYFENTEIKERRNFLVTLFKVANSSNKTDVEEMEEIRKIATSLKLHHSDFIAAKMTISSEDRGGR